MFELLLQAARWCQRIRHGVGTLPDLGPNPGTTLAAGLVGGALLAGGWRGGLLAACFVLPLYVSGCYERACLQERIDADRSNVAFLNRLGQRYRFRP